MGESAQTRLIRKLELQRFLSKVKFHPSPNAYLEQYTTSESAAATILYLAAYTYGSIVNKNILDLGCGTGRLALGAAFLGAASVVGVDIDRSAINIASENANISGFKDRVDWVEGDIDAISGSFDTVVQNPPFGVQKRAADRRFLEKALQTGDTIYSLHNHTPTDERLIRKIRASGEQFLRSNADAYLQRFIENRGGRIEAVFALPLTIPKMFDFHTKLKHQIVADLYVIKSPR